MQQSAIDAIEVQPDLVAFTANIVTAHVSRNDTSADEVPELISRVYGALSGLGRPRLDDRRPEPAVTIKSSVKPDHLVCLEDGKKMKTLKRHLMTDHGMTPEEYRAKWELPASYPMVAPAYTEERRELAKRLGLGRKANRELEVASEPAPETASEPAPETAPETAPEPKSVTRRGTAGKGGSASEPKPVTKRRAAAKAASDPETKPVAKRGRPKKTLSIRTS